MTNFRCCNRPFVRFLHFSFAAKHCIAFFASSSSSSLCYEISSRFRRNLYTSELFSTLPFDTLPYHAAEVRIPAVKPGSVATENSTFGNDEKLLKSLGSSIDYWKTNNYSSAWIHVPANRASLVSRLTDDAFSFDLHHVNAVEQTVVLKKWLRPNDEDKIPPFATHQCGCAGFVLSEENELLLVKEWTGPLSDRAPSKQWKLPGGLLDMGESFADASCREVMEETGVVADFESVLAFWHRHGLVFGKSDFYFVCLLRPKSKSINLDPVEISDAVWMPIEDFLETQDHPLILHVLKHSFHLDTENGMKQNSGRLQPVSEIIEGSVQWQNRQPYPTYTSRPSKNAQP